MTCGRASPVIDANSHSAHTRGDITPQGTEERGIGAHATEETSGPTRGPQRTAGTIVALDDEVGPNVLELHHPTASRPTLAALDPGRSVALKTTPPPYVMWKKWISKGTSPLQPPHQLVFALRQFARTVTAAARRLSPGQIDTRTWELFDIRDTPQSGPDEGEGSLSSLVVA
ncbi:hypothetical protein C2E23DRAFT_899040 [Lenzites betulinus]|nr:hypothetical protein C2E23DRAFT_899040 [Lenzites betulinus]